MRFDSGLCAGLLRHSRRSRPWRRFPAVSKTALTLLLLLAPALTGPRPLQAQEARDQLESAVERLERDRAAQLEFLAPRSFEQAEEAIERGRRAVAEAGTEEEIERRAEEANCP